MLKNHQAIRDFMHRNYRHFNSRTTLEASQGWVDQLATGNRMFLTLAGAMSTAEIGILLAEMIRAEKVHGICCTGANLEEDIFNLVAHESYEHIQDWRALSAEQEADLAARGMNRVTDTCIPEDVAMRRIETAVLRHWREADAQGKSRLPHEFLYDLLRTGELEEFYAIDPADSWMLAAAERDLPIFVPGWEDSTLGNLFVAATLRGEIKRLETMQGGLHYMRRLIAWYQEMTREYGLGFFQIGGGIAGDFPICVVPLIEQDLRQDTRLWSYFCQISDSTTSYGSYSGAVPNEKISWGKLAVDTPSYIIESDASIVAPLIFSYVLATGS